MLPRIILSIALLVLSACLFCLFFVAGFSAMPAVQEMPDSTANKATIFALEGLSILFLFSAVVTFLRSIRIAIYGE